MSDGMSDNFDGTKINAYPRDEKLKATRCWECGSDDPAMH